MCDAYTEMPLCGWFLFPVEILASDPHAFHDEIGPIGPVWRQETYQRVSGQNLLHTRGGGPRGPDHPGFRTIQARCGRLPLVIPHFMPRMEAYLNGEPTNGHER